MQYLIRNRLEEVRHEFCSNAIFSLHGIYLEGPAQFLSDINQSALMSIKILILQWHMYLPFYHWGVFIYGKAFDPSVEEQR